MTTVVRPTGPLNKAGLAKAVAAELQISQAEAHRAVEAVLNTIGRTVASGHQIAITNFGTWLPKHVPARAARNPQTGDLVTLPARTRLVFRASEQLQDAVKARDPQAAVITKRSRP